jgi:hypothetical protein
VGQITEKEKGLNMVGKREKRGKRQERSGKKRQNWNYTRKEMKHEGEAEKRGRKRDSKEAR